MWSSFLAHTQPVDLNILSSNGSPMGCPCRRTRVWQQAMHEIIGPGGSWLGSETTSEKPADPPSTTPHTSSPSSVRVPVWRIQSGSESPSGVLTLFIQVDNKRWLIGVQTLSEELRLCVQFIGRHHTQARCSSPCQNKTATPCRRHWCAVD